MTMGTMIYAVDEGRGPCGTFTVEPADPIDGAEMITVTVAMGEVQIRLVVQAVHVLDTVAAVAGLADAGPFLDLEQVAARVGVAYQTARKYRLDGKLPDADRLMGRRPLWRLSTIDQWHRARQRGVR